MNSYFKTQDSTTTYDVFQLFRYYNQFFFNNVLEKCSVRWTKKMTLCAGTCKYQGFGSSTISLSEPLLKFRNSNQLKETLLHQMIHAYLFITNPQACKTQGGHGPAFITIMEQINSISGLHLTIYHNFKDQVDHYRQHIWRCNGRCKDNPPFYGYVKRAMNRKPQPADHWFNEHKRTCGGQFLKISSPQKSQSVDSMGQKKEKKVKNKSKPKQKQKKEKKKRDFKSWGCGKSIADYMKQIEQDSKKKIQKGQEVTEKRIKTIQEYSYEMQKQEEQRKKNSQN